MPPFFQRNPKKIVQNDGVTMAPKISRFGTISDSLNSSNFYRKFGRVYADPYNKDPVYNNWTIFFTYMQLYKFSDYLEEQMREKQEKKRRELEKEKVKIMTGLRRTFFEQMSFQADDEALEAKIREDNLKMQREKEIEDANKAAKDAKVS